MWTLSSLLRSLSLSLSPCFCLFLFSLSLLTTTLIEVITEEEMEACLRGGEDEVPSETLFLSPFFLFKLEDFFSLLLAGGEVAGTGAFSHCSCNSSGWCIIFYTLLEAIVRASNLIGTISVLYMHSYLT